MKIQKKKIGGGGGDRIGGGGGQGGGERRIEVIVTMQKKSGWGQVWKGSRGRVGQGGGGWLVAIVGVGDDVGYVYQE